MLKSTFKLHAGALSQNIDNRDIVKEVVLEEKPIDYTTYKLSIRMQKGDPIHRDGRIIPSYETIFTLRQSGRVTTVHAPYAICKTINDFLGFRDDVRQLLQHKLSAPFPFVYDKPELEAALTESQLSERCVVLSTWCMQVFECFSKLEKAHTFKVLKMMESFYLLGKKKARVGMFETVNKADLAACKVAIKECLLLGFEHRVEATKNARFYTIKKPLERGWMLKLKHFLEKQKKIDHFEQRFDKGAGCYYLFNPHTGETISDATQETGNDRRSSFKTWLMPDKFAFLVPEQAQHVMLYPVPYASRYWGTRPFRGFSSEQNKRREQAATILTSVARGFVARQRMKLHHQERYQKVFCKENRCCYFFDTWHGTSSWLMPYLANPFDILDQPLDLRNDTSLADGEYCNGPLLTRVTLSKALLQTYVPPVVEVDLRMPTEREPELIDFNETAYRLVIIWLDGNVQKLSSYAELYSYYIEEDWKKILKCMKKYPDEIFVQLYGMHAFSRMQVKAEESGLCPLGVKNALKYLLEKLRQSQATMRYGCNYQLFNANAILHILQLHAARVDFFNTDEVEKDNTQAKVADQELSPEEEMYLDDKLKTFTKFFRSVPTEVTKEQLEKGFKINLTDVARPTQRASEFLEILFQIVGVLAHERETRTFLAIHCSLFVLHALKICFDEMFCTKYGLRCVYNFCFMCAIGQNYLLEETDIEDVIKAIKKGPLSGDAEIIREVRRVELALQPNGWRGKVELQIEEEIKAETEGFLSAFASSPEFPQVKDGKPKIKKKGALTAPSTLGVVSSETLLALKNDAFAAALGSLVDKKKEQEHAHRGFRNTFGAVWSKGDEPPAESESPKAKPEGNVEKENLQKAVGSPSTAIKSK